MIARDVVVADVVVEFPVIVRPPEIVDDACDTKPLGSLTVIEVVGARNPAESISNVLPNELPLTQTLLIAKHPAESEIPPAEVEVPVP